MDPLEDRYHDMPSYVKHDMDIDSYYCEYGRCWVAFDANLEPDENGGQWWHPKGEGRTREEAVSDLIDQWEDAQRSKEQ